MDKALRIKDKLEKYAKIDELKETIVEKYRSENESLKDDELKTLLTKVKLVLEEIESITQILLSTDNLFSR